MKKTIIIVLFLAVAIIVSIPFIDGYLFKNTFYQQVALAQQELQKNEGESVKIQVESYNMGWLSSTANLLISDKNQSMRIQSIIHHGPLVFLNNIPGMASALVETTIFLPDKARMLVPPEINFYLRIDSLVSLDGNLWKTNYFIPPIAYKNILKWDGLKGEITTQINGNDFERVDNQLTFGSIRIQSPQPFLPGISMQEFSSNSQLNNQRGIWNGNTHTSIPVIIATWKDGRIVNLGNLDFTSTSNGNNKSFNYKTILTIASLQVPPPFPVNKLNKINFDLVLKDINVVALNKKLRRSPDSDFLKILNSGSSATLKLGLDSELGKLSADMNCSLSGVPVNIDDLKNKVNAVINARIAQAFFDKILIAYVASMMDDKSQAADKEKLLVDKIIQRGVISKEQNDYVISLANNGGNSILNSRPIADEDVKNLLTNLKSDLLEVMKPVASNASSPASGPVSSPNAAEAPALAPASVPAPGSSSGSAPAAAPVQPGPVAGGSDNNHCYWMDSSSGQDVWHLVSNYSKADCYAADSCYGGLRQMHDGCYKWAPTEKAEPLPWSK